MSDDSEDSDKQFKASQKKLDDARQKGEVPRSADLTTAASYCGIVCVLTSLAGGSLLEAGEVLVHFIAHADELEPHDLAGSLQSILSGWTFAIAIAVMPWFALPAFGAIVSILAQQSMIITPSRIAFRWSRISLVQGAKTKFGRQGLFEFGKSFLKLVLYSGVLGSYMTSRLDDIVATMFLSPAMAIIVLGQMSLSLLVIVFAIALALGGLDLLWQRLHHARKHRMSRQELIDEQKQQDGDPAMKQQRRQRAIDLAMNRMLADVPGASVIIVNPTHYAVALHWPGTAGSAPICVAKGLDAVAMRIREIAAAHDVPVHSDPPTARALHAAVEIGQEIAPEQYQAVATAIRFAQDLRLKARWRA